MQQVGVTFHQVDPEVGIRPEKQVECVAFSMRYFPPKSQVRRANLEGGGLIPGMNPMRSARVMPTVKPLTAPKVWAVLKEKSVAS